MEELNEVNLRKAMHSLTKEGLIPDYLKVEMCLMPDAILNFQYQPWVFFRKNVPKAIHIRVSY